MMLEAEQRQGQPRAKVIVHIGDFTHSFWTGVYPEALSHLQAPDHRDHLLDYLEQGKRSYLIASTYQDNPYQDEAPILRQRRRRVRTVQRGSSTGPQRVGEAGVAKLSTQY